jgi:hypothetical protein
MLASMRQISDVVLVHDERALSDPPADASLGYCRLVGAQVLTQSGQELGRVRWAPRRAERAVAACRAVGRLATHLFLQPAVTTPL